MKKNEFAKIACIAAIFCVATAIASHAQTFTTLASFGGTDGNNPQYAGLTQGADGNFYGTTIWGGSVIACGNGNTFGCGNVYKITPSRTLTTVYSFCSQPSCADGDWPTQGVTLGANGNLYGTVQLGGAHSAGTVFEVSPSGQFATLYSFCSIVDNQQDCLDGATPESKLFLASDGNFYGTTKGGGVHNGGTVFKISPSGKLTTIYAFCTLTKCADGDFPLAGVIQGTDGNFYGTTAYGGAGNGGVYGTVFKLTPTGTLTTLYSFCSVKPNCADGALPEAPLVQAANGNLYGTTLVGTANCGGPGCGTVFEITTSGTLTTVHAFCSETGCTDGGQPYAGLVQATDGNLYGTTHLSRTESVIYQVTPAGNYSTVHTFCTGSSCTNGDAPYAGLMQSTNGILYGTTTVGGTSSTCQNCGVVYSFSIGAAAFVEALPNAAAPEHVIGLLGNGLKGTTSVTFNGVSATFTVVSNTAIKVTVPAGATTGTIQVTTKSGTLSSNVSFQVL
jgi:uncharacterized repeat protein (TIGR03803 family)